LEIHKPKQVESWRDLLKEVAVIVIGIAIALTGEQIIESLHWAHRVHEAEDAMRVELIQNNMDAYYRLASEPCAKQQLDEIETLLIASRDHDLFIPAVKRYARPLRPWLSDAWASAQALQITSHIAQQRLAAYSQVYFFPSVMRSTQPLERQAMSELNTISVNAGHLQPAERDRLFLALSRTRDRDKEMALGAWLLIQRTEAVGYPLSPSQKLQQLAMARENFGGCVAEPDVKNEP
jgi:hypothetical protein